MQFKEDIYYIERILQGDIQSFSFLVEKHKRMAYTLALKLVRSPEDAEEIAHDAFLKVFQSLKNFRQDSKFTTWLYKIVFNLCVSRLRKKKTELLSISNYNWNLPEFSEQENVFSNLSLKEQGIMIRNAVDLLPDDERTVVVLFYLNECPVKEIIEITGYTESNVKIKLYRARKKLWERLHYMNDDQNSKVYAKE